MSKISYHFFFFFYLNFTILCHVDFIICLSSAAKIISVLQRQTLSRLQNIKKNGGYLNHIRYTLQIHIIYK